MAKAKLSLRIGLAFVFLFASISSILSPQEWIGFIPAWIQKLPPGGDLQLKGHAIFELALGIWLLTGWKGFWAALVAAADLTVITLVNVTAISVVFRDIGLALSALALIFLNQQSAKK